MTELEKTLDEIAEKACSVGYSINFPITSEFADLCGIQFRGGVARSVAEVVNGEATGGGSGMGEMDFFVSSGNTDKLAWKVQKVRKVLSDHKIANAAICLSLFDKNEELISRFNF